MRKFVYEGRTFPDPDPRMNIDEVRHHFMESFPALNNASSSETKDGEDTITTFTKRVGTKGDDQWNTTE